MTHIVEYIGKEGVQHTPYDHTRGGRPRPGDIVEWPNGKFGMIWQVGDGFVGPDEIYVCEQMGSAFLGWNSEKRQATVDISGGPFIRIKKDELEASFRLKAATYWNWGNNMPGAGKGVDYTIVRPVFRYTGDSTSSYIR